MNAGGDSAPLFTEKADVLVKDAPMFMEGYNSEAKKFSLSFPDFRIKVLDSGVKEQADGTVTIFVCASGTHSGEPYSFGPYPEIPATHIRVVNDPERFTFTIQNGKISKLVIEPQGVLTGPLGFYNQIGGLIF